MRTILAVWAAILAIGVASGAAETAPAVAAPQALIIPQPAKLSVKQGTFTLTADTVVGYADADARQIAAALADALSPATGFRLKVRQGQPGNGNSVFLTTANAARALGAEGYTLSVTPHGAVIRAAPMPAGLFYGMQTLFQLLPLEIESTVPVTGNTWSLPCVEIADQPRFPWRGLLLDVSRHFFTTDEVKAYIDRMARYKLNVLQLHLTDDQGWRIKIEKYPRLTEIGAWRVPRVGDWWHYDPPQPGERASYGGFYGPAEIRELVSYARQRFVTILPEIEMPGHAMAMLAAYPQLSCLGGSFTVNPGSQFYGKIQNALCPGKDTTFTLLEGVIAEVAALFPGKYIHIGGDEAFKGFWNRCPDCQRRMQAEGLKNVEELQSYFVKRVEKILESKGKRLIGWDEILEGGLAPRATVMSWRGTGGGIAAAKMRHQVVMSPSPFYYLDLYQGEPRLEPSTYGMARLSTTYAFEPVPAAVDAKLILGVQGNLWTESICTLRHAEYMTWPRGLAIAETAWSPQQAKNWPEFIRRAETQFLRFDAADAKYARSIYDPSYVVRRGADRALLISLSSELPGVAIHYTFDGSEPDAHYPKYDSPLRVPKNATTLRAVVCRTSKVLGRMLSLPIAELEKQAGH